VRWLPTALQHVCRYSASDFDELVSPHFELWAPNLRPALATRRLWLGQPPDVEHDLVRSACLSVAVFARNFACPSGVWLPMCSTPSSVGSADLSVVLQQLSTFRCRCIACRYSLS
jgi:hypothetical protein